MANDLPPRFTTDLEDSLNTPSPLRTPHQHQQPLDPTTMGRPPEEEPTAPPENLTTMVFVKFGAARAHMMEAEIRHLTFTPCGTHLAATLPRVHNIRLHNPEGPWHLVVWSATKGHRIALPSSALGLRVNGGFAFKPLTATADMVVACPLLHAAPMTADTMGQFMSRLEVYDLGRKERMLKQDIPVRAPVAWSPGGGRLAGVAASDPSRIVVLGIGQRKDAIAKMERVLMKHEDDVTQLAFLPPGTHSSGATTALVSAGKDWCLRVTCVESGRTLQKIEIGARAPAKMLQVSHDGQLVVTVWGRDVVLWYLGSGRVHNYNLNAVRLSEGWPLCVSPDCRYLCCRTEEGFDVSDVTTGKFRGEFAWTGQVVTAAAFNSDGTRLAVADYSGAMQMFEIVTP